MKKKRVVDEELLEVVRELPCLACLKTPSEAHHITSRGAGGDDTPFNVMPLCHEHHRQWHDRGAVFMWQQYPTIRFWLESAGREDVLSREKKLACRAQA